jgi:hypothetical protein
MTEVTFGSRQRRNVEIKVHDLMAEVYRVAGACDPAQPRTGRLAAWDMLWEVDEALLDGSDVHAVIAEWRGRDIAGSRTIKEWIGDLLDQVEAAAR